MTLPVLKEALRQIGRGHHVIDVPLGQKGPIRDKWPQFALTIDAAKASEIFQRDSSNLGLLLHPDLYDTDIDCAQALALIHAFPTLLPHTDAVSGRPSKPRSHHFYKSHDVGMHQFRDVDGTMLVELRHGAGIQTLIPPSCYIEDGGQEYAGWDSDGYPTEVDGRILETKVRRLAARALLLRHYPQNGSRHEFALALSGALFNRDYSIDDIAELLEPVATLAHDEELTDRLCALKSTAQAHAKNEPHSGWPTLIRILGQPVVERLADFLQIGKRTLDEGPRPLHREIPAATCFPVSMLGAPLDGAVRAIGCQSGAPLSLAATSVLAAVIVVAQGKVDVVLPIGKARPISLFFVSIAESGERKSTVDSHATRAIRDREHSFEGSFKSALVDWKRRHLLWTKERDRIAADKRDYPSIDAKYEALRNLGPEPQPPQRPEILCSEPTAEGLIRLLKEGCGSCGLFADEAAAFLGGYAMAPERRLATAGHLCSLWDGEPLRRPRQGGELDILRGRRLSMHLLVQPLIANRLFDDVDLQNQGLLSRILAIKPDSAIGSRAWHEPTTEELAALENFNNLVRKILTLPPPIVDGTTSQLTQLILEPEARALWIEFSQINEKLMARGGEYESIRGLANKLAEIAARIAGGLTLVRHIWNSDSLSLPSTIERRTLADAIVIAQFYASEAVRIGGESGIDEKLQLAALTLRWLQNDWREPNRLVSLPDLYRLGPNAIRDKASASGVVQVLVDHGWLIEVKPQNVNGKPRRAVWRIVEE